VIHLPFFEDWPPTSTTQPSITLKPSETATINSYLKSIDSLTSKVYCGTAVTFINAPLPRKASSEPKDSGCRNNGASKVRITIQLTSDVYSLYKTNFSRAFTDREKHRLSGIVASTSSRSGGSKSGASHKSNGTNSSRDELSRRRPVSREVSDHLRLHTGYTTVVSAYCSRR
jgi:hypothetical protein